MSVIDMQAVTASARRAVRAGTFTDEQWVICELVDKSNALRKRLNAYGGVPAVEVRRRERRIIQLIAEIKELKGEG